MTMRLIVSLFLSFFLLNSCGPKVTQEMQESTIEYQALSRGFYLNVIIQGKKMAIIREREGLRKEYVLTNADYKEVASLYQKIKLNELNEYKAPTEKRFYDGAAIANLTINYQGQSYHTSGFDHGNPPVEIADFINKIVSFTEN